MVVRTICEICLSDVHDGGEGWEGILMMHNGVRRRCLVVVTAMGNIRLNVVDKGGEGGGGEEAIFCGRGHCRHHSRGCRSLFLPRPSFKTNRSQSRTAE